MKENIRGSLSILSASGAYETLTSNVREFPGFPLGLTDKDMADKSPIDMNPDTISDRDRARLAARRMAEALLPYFGTGEAQKQSGTGARFTPRRIPDAFAVGKAITEVWRNACFFTPVPQERFFPCAIHVDAEGRLHNDTGPSVVFSDGMKTYHIHGIEVGSAVVYDPGSIPIPMIRDCKNIELRRVLIDKFGKSRFIAALGLKPVHIDDWGELYRAPVPNDEDLVMVKVVNNTPEPDGSYKDYWLPVPPSMKTAKEAVAWTWGEDGAEFNPTQRS